MAKSGIFDMIGPVMIGPSSSHTAGCAKIAYVARKLLDAAPTKAILTLYNSFARTYEGHGSDKALVGGLLGYAADDARIRDALSHAAQQGLVYEIKTAEQQLAYHPNTVHLSLEAATGQSLSLLGISTGGGSICISQINGFHTDFTATLPTLLVFAHDTSGDIALIASLLSHEGCNIASMTLARRARQSDTCMVIEIDQPPSKAVFNYLNTCQWASAFIYLEGFG